MPVRREPLLAAVLPAMPRADATAERTPPHSPRKRRVIGGARASFEDVKAAAAELHEREGR